MSIIVMFNECEPADSLAFPSWARVRKYVVDKICSDFEWRSKAWHIYHAMREYIELNSSVVSDFYSFEEWYVDMNYTDMIELTSYFGYSAIEEIDYCDI